ETEIGKARAENRAASGSEVTPHHLGTEVAAVYLIITKRAADMASQYRIECDRGTIEFRQWGHRNSLSVGSCLHPCPSYFWGGQGPDDFCADSRRRGNGLL